MKSIALLIAVAAAALLMAAPSGAHLFRPDCNAKLAPKAELRCAKLNRQHALATIAWAKGQLRRINLFDASRSLTLNRIVVNHRWLYKTMTTRVGEAERRVLASTFPRHHLLWLCIHGTPSLGTPVGHEASRWDTRATNGHYGGLQMHPRWKHGTSYYASDDPQLVQENAAEEAYRESGYSASFLIGQWGATIGPCWKYAG